jgi:hypothetical protein
VYVFTVSVHMFKIIIISVFFIWNTQSKIHAFFFPIGATAPSGPGPPRYRGFTITLRHTTLGRTPLDEWSAPLGDLCVTTHNIHDRHPCPPPRFEPAIPASERPQTHALDRAATWIGTHNNYSINNILYYIILHYILYIILITDIHTW